jgi:SAM-dependent methyltransferase
MNPALLTKQIDRIVNNDAGEPDLYAYIKELLTRRQFSIDLDVTQVVVDTKIDDSRRRPDLVAYKTVGGKPVRGPDYAHAVFEVKLGDRIATDPRSVFRDKRSYIQPGTAWFFLIDQVEVVRIDCRQGLASEPYARGQRTLPPSWTWDRLRDPDTFLECFGPLARSELQLENELQAFKKGLTAFSYLHAVDDGRRLFAETVREAATLLRDAIETIIIETVIPDLQEAQAAIALLEADYGVGVFDWNRPQRPIDFTAVLDERASAALDEALHLSYDTRHDALMDDIRDKIYALRIEHVLIPQYAARQGIKAPSLLDIKGAGEAKKSAEKLVTSLAYETGALILSRMLMIRFSEDHELFTNRFISNGGVEVFWNYAEHFNQPMQALLRETYKASAELFRSIFDPNVLDWPIDRTDTTLSNALTRVAYILSRWDFRTVHGDILSGVYDKYLDVSQRRRLGEVYTRPEVARYMLKAASWDPADRVLDPACGTGTFLVEALVTRLKALREVGAINDASVRMVIERLHGLDISPFSIALAQIQIFWHLVELMKEKSVAEARSFAKAILPAIKLYGGWSSLDPMGHAFGADKEDVETAQLGLSFRLRRGERGTSTLRPVGFERTARGQYDLVIMNPPYIRVERKGNIDYSSIYGEVSYMGTDTSVFFIYRALRQWLKPGGRLAFIVPIGVLEAEYGGLLRKLLRGYKITRIADLEGLGKETFRGVKRATVIVVVENTPPGADDEIELVQLDRSAMTEDDTIDFGKAVVHTVRRTDLDRTRYLPPEAAMQPWFSTIKVGAADTTAMLTKLAPTDVPVLDTMAGLPRLGAIIKLVWRKGPSAQVEAQRPIHEGYKWQQEMVFSYGIKVGGSQALSPIGSEGTRALYKGQNIFTGGLLGEPMGGWNPTSKVLGLYVYTYMDYLETENLFAIRELSQLPTACPVAPTIAMQNSAFVFQLTEAFPVHLYLMSRVIQFYAARVLRSSVIEDLGCHWYKRTIPFLPIPVDRSSEACERLSAAGNAVLKADDKLADRYREINALMKDAGRRTLNTLFVDGDATVEGIDLNGVSEDPTALVDLKETDDGLATADGVFTMRIPDADLRTYLLFEIQRLADAKTDTMISRETVVGIAIPHRLAEIATLIRSLENQDFDLAFADAMTELDRVVAELLGLSEEQRDYAVAQMRSDPILSQMRPMYAHRGLRVQPYTDRSGTDRYA